MKNNYHKVKTQNHQEQKEVKEVEKTYGYVIATKLNVRKQPNKDSEVVTEVCGNTKLEIDLNLSNFGWYKVHTESGLEGYCMKEYVSVL